MMMIPIDDVSLFHATLYKTVISFLKQDSCNHKGMTVQLFDVLYV